MARAARSFSEAAPLVVVLPPRAPAKETVAFETDSLVTWPDDSHDLHGTMTVSALLTTGGHARASTPILSTDEVVEVTFESPVADVLQVELDWD